MKKKLGRPVKKHTGEGKKYGVRTQQELHPNQWTGTPMQEKFLLLYLDPKSPTFANPYASALEAGYTEYYARVIAAPSVGREWIKEARDLVKMGPEHITQALQDEAMNKRNKASDRIRALELVGKMQGVFIDRQIVGHVNIESALNDLK